MSLNTQIQLLQVMTNFKSFHIRVPSIWCSYTLLPKSLTQGFSCI